MRKRLLTIKTRNITATSTESEDTVLDARAKLFGYNINPLLLCRFCCSRRRLCLSSLLLSSKNRQLKQRRWRRQREWQPAQQALGINGRGERELPLPSRVSLARARSFLHPFIPSACYAGYENGKKQQVQINKTTTLHLITLFCTFLSRRCTTATPYFLISRAHFMEQVNTT